MKKYKATINIEREKWKRYLERCRELGSDGSKEFKKFVDCFIEGKSYKYETEDDWDNLPESVKVFEDILVERVLARLKYRQLTIEEELAKQQWKNGNTQSSIKMESETDTLEEVTEVPSEPIRLPTEELEMPTQQGTQTDSTPENLKPSSNSKQEVFTEMSKVISPRPPLPEGHLEDWQRECFTDTFVAKEEGVNKSTIVRRRQNQNKDKNPDFWERWETSTLNPTRWWRVQTVSQTNESAKQVAS